MRFNINVVDTEMPPMVELARRAVELAEHGADVIRVDQGAVDIRPPAAFTERVIASLAESDVHRYAPDPGLPGHAFVSRSLCPAVAMSSLSSPSPRASLS